MSRISTATFQKVAENALQALYEQYPVLASTYAVSKEIARDNEFTLKVLEYLKGKGVVEKISRERKVFWKLSLAAKKNYDSAVARR